MREEFAVADGLEGGEVGEREERAGLGFETVGNHLVDTGVDSGVEFFAWADEGELEDSEGARLRLARAEGGDGASTDEAELEGVEDTAWVAEIGSAAIDGVDGLEA